MIRLPNLQEVNVKRASNLCYFQVIIPNHLANLLYRSDSYLPVVKHLNIPYCLAGQFGFYKFLPGAPVGRSYKLRIVGLCVKFKPKCVGNNSSCQILYTQHSRGHKQRKIIKYHIPYIFSVLSVPSSGIEGISTAVFQVLNA